MLIAPRRLGEILREPVLVAAAAGFALTLARRPAGGGALLVALVAVAVAFAGLAAAGLPVIARYLLAIAVLLAILAASGTAALLQRHSPLALRLAGGALAVWLALAAPDQSQRLAATAAVLQTQRAISAELHLLADTGRLTGSCRPLSLPNHRAVPAIA